MTKPNDTPTPVPAADATPHVACLCAAWCRLCDSYREVFEGVTGRLRGEWPAFRVHWIDIEDDAELIGDLDIETFPTLLVADASGVRFAGPLAPNALTLERVLRAAVTAPGPTAGDPRQAAAYAQLAARLRNG